MTEPAPQITARYVPYTLEALQTMIQEDLKMDRTAIIEESIKTASLFSKYMNILSRERTLLNGLKKQREDLEFSKYQFYTGKTEGEVSPLRVLKAEADKYIGADPDVSKAKDRLIIQQEKVDLLVEVIKHINSRTFTISNIIKAVQFQNGM